MDPSRVSGDAVQLARAHVVDEARDGDVLREERVRPDALDLRAHVLLQIRERVEVDLRGVNAVLRREFLLDFLLLEREHAAVRVVDDDELARSQEVREMMRDRSASSVASPPAFRTT